MVVTFEGEVVGPGVRHGGVTDEEYSERLEIVNCTENMDLKQMRTVRDSQ
ncbi:hypothetical protein A2U01_0065037, partial [Trifolium medium]|nr:hypothetical protein [Trifolium medium]